MAEKAACSPQLPVRRDFLFSLAVAGEVNLAFLLTSREHANVESAVDGRGGKYQRHNRAKLEIDYGQASSRPGKRKNKDRSEFYQRHPIAKPGKESGYDRCR